MKKLLFCLLLVALAISTHIQHCGCNQPNLKRKFKLTFQYACRQGVSFSSCKGDVLWNGKKIFSVAPNNYKVQTKVLYVFVNSGKNELKFQGSGCADGYGLTIDNVRLVRYVTKVNIVVNGGFEKPCVGKGWKIFNDIPGWWGKGFEIGSAHLYNCRWGKTQVCELDGRTNGHLAQSWNFNKDYNIVKPQNNRRKFKLSFQYACRQGVSFNSCKGNIFWNGKRIFSVAPKDYKVHTKTIQVLARVGGNALKFQGSGCSDRLGLTIDNVKLIRYGSKISIVVNGGFEKPNVGKGWKVFNDIPGWWGKGFEIGSAHLYNCRWGKTQVCELDGHKNAYLTQKWKFNKDYNIVKKSVPRKYKLQFQYACRQGQPFESCQGNVYWNGKNILSIKPHNYKVVTKSLYVHVKVGQNMLKF